MRPIYKSEEGKRAVQQQYQQILQGWPVANQQLRVPTREGEMFVVVCGAEQAPPVLLLHGAMANSSMWMGYIRAWAPYLRIFSVDMIGEPGLSAPARPSLSTEAHALWLDDVIQGLGLRRASLVGISLGGWLALDYATRRPGHVEKVVLLCPGGVGRQKIGTALKLMVLGMCGDWGKRKARKMVFGPAPASVPPTIQKLIDFMLLIHNNFRPRQVKIPIFSAAALRRLTMPVMAILGGKDVLLDSDETKRRLEKDVPHAVIHYLPEVGHMITGQAAPILEFLRSPNMMEGSTSHDTIVASHETNRQC